MTDRERLMELLCKVECEGEESLAGCPERKYGRCRSIDKLEYCKVGAIADHLLANGAIVPPCKVEDWVWYIRNNKVNKAKIEECVYSASKHGYFSEDWRFHAYNFSKKEEITFWVDDIGKTVFLTKEEAEQALKERESGG